MKTFELVKASVKVPAGIVAALGVVGLLGGCAAFENPNSPDRAYSEGAAEATRLQVPPDLTSVGEGEQFILPGTAGGPLTRNTLLPQLDSVRYERAGAQSWLRFEQTPEELWPRLVDFLQRRGYAVDTTRPVDGTLATRWRPASELGESSVLRSLVGGGDSRVRIGFRLERAGAGTDAGARLFAREQVARGKAVDAGGVADWPASSSNPETTSTLLADFLVFLGIDEQRSRGIIDAAGAADVLDDAVLRSSSSGSQLVVHRGYRSAFEALGGALERTGRTIDGRDDNVGRIEFAVPAPADADAAVTDGAAAMTLTITPVNIGAVRVGVTDREGRRLDAASERGVLESLRAELA